MEKQRIQLGSNDYNILAAIIDNLSVVLGRKNRIRAISSVLLKHFADKGAPLSTATIHRATQKLLTLGFVKEIEKTKVNGDKRPVMVYEFQQEFFDSVEVINAGDMRGHRTTTKKKQAKPVSKRPTPETKDFLSVAEQRFEQLCKEKAGLENTLAKKNEEIEELSKLIESAKRLREIVLK
ncbi:MAG TPA: hypothetical protein VF817_03330 [Patescibacteria group bacterium]